MDAWEQVSSLWRGWGVGGVLLDRTLPQNTKSTTHAASFPHLFSIYLPSAPLCRVLCRELGGRQKGVAFILEFTWETDTHNSQQP